VFAYHDEGGFVERAVGIEVSEEGVEVVTGRVIGAVDTVVMVPVADVEFDEAGALVGGENLLGDEAGVAESVLP